MKKSKNLLDRDIQEIEVLTKLYGYPDNKSKTFKQFLDEQKEDTLDEIKTLINDN